MTSPKYKLNIWDFREKPLSNSEDTMLSCCVFYEWPPVDLARRINIVRYWVSILLDGLLKNDSWIPACSIGPHLYWEQALVEGGKEMLIYTNISLRVDNKENIPVIKSILRDKFICLIWPVVESEFWLNNLDWSL